jgi:hypothetical protein
MPISMSFGFYRSDDWVVARNGLADRIVATQRATGRLAFVDMFSRFSPANERLTEAVADQRYGPLLALEVDGRTAQLWPGYDLGLSILALDMMQADFDRIPGC